MNVCLLNDSFPPLIDGVANTVVNYAKEIEKFGGRPIVVTPEYPEADDSQYSYPILRYPGMDFRKQVGYYAGYPFSPEVAKKLQEEKVEIMHSHCPIASTMMARSLRDIIKVPVVLTYHTKFDVDIENVLPGKLLQEGAVKVLVDNINACDEVWTVSKGAGENLRALGYEGEYTVMQNGVDIPRGRLSDDEVAGYLKDRDIPAGVPIFLFVGRLMWYKGIKIIIDALAALKSQELDFRMVFVGKGTEENEIKEYVRSCGLMRECIFTGPIYDRRELSAWYCKADLFLFPSTFDTNGLVVREAAASSLASVLIKGSCAAEGVKNGVDGYLIEENAASLAVLLARIMDKKDVMKRAGEKASEDLYLSWEDAIKAAYDRYPAIVENYKAGKYKRSLRPTDGIYKLNAEMMDSINRFYQRQNDLREWLDFGELREKMDLSSLRERLDIKELMEKIGPREHFRSRDELRTEIQNMIDKYL